jgi:hypothetical protein
MNVSRHPSRQEADRDVPQWEPGPSAEAHRTIRVRIRTTDGQLVRGEVTVKVGGYHGRLSDVLNDPRPFLPLTRVQVYSPDGERLYQEPFLALNKQTIASVHEEASW